MTFESNEKSHHRFRLIFCFPSGGTITPREDEEDHPVAFAFETGTGQQGTLGTLGLKPLSETDEFEVSVGGYQTAEEAWTDAQELAKALLVLCADQGIGVDIGGVEIGIYSEGKASEGTVHLSPGFFGDLPEKEKRQVIIYKRGITVVKQLSADYGYKTIGLKGKLTLQPFSLHGLWAAWMEVAKKQVSLDESTALALELYNAAFFEHSMRAKFLTWILMLESLAKPKPRSAEIIKLVEQLAETCKEAQTTWPNKSDKRSFQGIASTLSHMKNESIGQSLQRLVEEMAGDIEVASQKPSKFIRKCYDVRSSLVHDGTTGISNGEFFQLVHNLQNLSIHILRAILAIEPLQVRDEWHGSVSFRSEIIV